MAEQQFDTFICVHHRDVSYLLELVLRSYRLNFLPKGRLMMITNDLPHLREFVARIGLEGKVVLSDDREWLSKEEMELPGWFKQQLIKLRSYQFCETPNFCCLGADTVMLQPILESDLNDNGKPVLYYTRHLLPDSHFRYEKARVNYIGELLKVSPVSALRYVDFINDLFCFNRDALISLNDYLRELYGDNPYTKLLQGIQDKPENRNKFGEWTLYSVYLLDKLKIPLTLRDTREGFLYQAHSQLYLRLFRFNTKVVHFVSKDFDVDYISRQIAKHKLALANG
ncbi:MAG: DUF6492 family protein [Chloroflexi bacterium]|nr:DUF6492 family protein [Chloroflexota bacterium]MCC6891666.1 hypothetical protein [Anaerolineae bacterium]